MDIFSAVAIAILTTLCIIQYIRSRELQKISSKHEQMTLDNANLKLENRELQVGLIDYQDQLGEERDRNRNLLSQKKSSETRLGQISENIVPFLDVCPYNPKSMHFMGSPVDYLVYDLDQGEIVFVEIKTGNSKESKRQKIIKNIIKSGKVYYEQIRLSQKGAKIRREKNVE